MFKSFIEIKDLNVNFDSEDKSITALENINLTVEKNEFVCVMGTSGCGKTTLLNVIAGFIKPSKGKILLKGKTIDNPGPDRAVVFQDDAVFPWMTVEQNISFSYRVAKKYNEKNKLIVNKFLKLVGLEDFKDYWPKQLSGGMRKRVDLARGYAANPEVLLMDEPFGALDIMTKENLQEELHKLWVENPKTIVFITHDIDEAVFLGDKVILMTPRPGKIDLIIEPKLKKNRDMSVKTNNEFIDNVKKIRSRLQKH